MAGLFAILPPVGLCPSFVAGAVNYLVWDFILSQIDYCELL